MLNLKDLTPDKIFYLNSLDLDYARQFKDKEFLELQTIKLYLDLCEQIDIYLKEKGTSLQKRFQKMSHGYMSYNNTFYSLYFVSENSVEEFYYGRNYQETDYPFRLLQEQINSKIVPYLEQYLELRLPQLPEVPEDLKSHIYKDLTPYQAIGLAFKRLKLNKQQKKLFNHIPIKLNSFTDIEQCLDETVKMLFILFNRVENQNQKNTKIVQKTLDYLNPNLSTEKRRSINLWSNSYRSFMHSVFRVCESKLRKSYGFRDLDIDEDWHYLITKVGKKNTDLWENLIASYKPNLPSTETQIALNSKNKTRWKIELEELLNSDLDLSELKTKCDELLELNSQNSSQHLIYLELCKQFVKKSKTTSLWYYYKYYELLTFKNSSVLNLPEPKPLPKSIVKIIFSSDEEKLKKFEIICRTRNPLNHDEEYKKEEIKDLFKIKRKELKLDLSQTQKAHQVHSEMTAKLNQVLQEEEELDNQKQTSQAPKKVAAETTHATSLKEFFANDASSNSDIDFTEIESEFLSLFKQNSFKLDEQEVSNFAKAKKQFKNSLIKKINQKFYEAHEDNLIEQEDGIYSISNHNQELI